MPRFFLRACGRSAALLLLTTFVAWTLHGADDVAAPADGKSAVAAPAVDYATQIRPLFEKHCYACHQGKKPASGFRIDTGTLALKGGDRGAGVVPGKSDESPLYQALVGKGDIAQMPQDADPLTAEEIALVKAWIDAGAKFPEGEVAKDARAEPSKHWAFQPIRKPAFPAVSRPEWVQNGIDRFVLARLDQEKMAPSTEADRSTLIRRLSLDLRGLPPSPAELEEFFADDRPGAYERLVDRMLASPQFGERWGRHWLDSARYADSNGFTIDGARAIWKYRDWVIDALNRDLPFDRFTIEQLAGDLLPDASREQLIATGFHRNTLVNEEGGTDQEQFRVEAVVDRVSTTGSVWMGLTVGCAQCHEHKYDPISQREFYELFAVLNNCDEPKIQVPTSEQSQKLSVLDADIAAAEKALAAHDAESLKGFAEWEKLLAERVKTAAEWTVLEPVELKSEKGSVLDTQPDKSVFVDFSTPPNDVFFITGDVSLPEITAIRLEALTNSSLPMNGPGRSDNGNFVLSEFELRCAPKPAGDAKAEPAAVKLAKAVADHSQEGYLVDYAIDGKKNTGWAIGVKQGNMNVNREAIFLPATPIRNEAGTRLTVVIRHDHADAKFLLGQFRLSVSSAPIDALSTPAAIRAIVLTPEDKRTPAQKQQLEAAYRESDAARKPFAETVGNLKKDREQLVKEIPTTLVLQERKAPRDTHIMIRGDFLRHGAKVKPNVPAFLPPLTADGRDPNRLDFAKWLVDPNHPLTPRVTVNRVWQQLFGAGLVVTENDFGLQGAPPTHPELLDWLAAEFAGTDSAATDGAQPVNASNESLAVSQSSPWSLKSLIRLIVTSATYRQSSSVTPESYERDQANRWLARQSRVRLEAEIVRDAALEASGFLTETIGGPGVYPPQPEGIYVLTQVKKAWPESKGPDRYRRGMYTYFWRSSPYPLMPTFDAPEANTACTRRTRSNTPLQALTLANDRSFVELAKGLAARILKEAPPYDEGRLRYGFRASLSRDPSGQELARMSEFLEKQKSQFVADEKKAKEVAPTELPENVAVSEGASWTAVARVLINLDEFITRE